MFFFFRPAAIGRSWQSALLNPRSCIALLRIPEICSFSASSLKSKHALRLLLQLRWCWLACGIYAVWFSYWFMLVSSSSHFAPASHEGVLVSELHLKHVVLLGDSCMKNRIGAKKNLLKKTPQCLKMSQVFWLLIRWSSNIAKWRRCQRCNTIPASASSFRLPDLCSCRVSIMKCCQRLAMSWE